MKYSQGLRNGRALKMARPAVVCLLSAMLAMAACNGSEGTTTPAVAVEWGYEGPGAPESWASLSEEYAACADGEQQSPVDIAGYVEGDAVSASFSYGSDATAVRNDGKFVHVDYAPGSVFSLGQRSFELKSAHLHAPSEHRIDGASFAAELHLVHADADDRLTVAALLFRLGDPSPIAQAILDAAPACRRHRPGRPGAQCRRLRAGRTRLLPVRWLQDHSTLPRAGGVVRDARAKDHFTGAGRQPDVAERRPQQSSCPAHGQPRDNNRRRALGNAISAPIPLMWFDGSPRVGIGCSASKDGGGGRGARGIRTRLCRRVEALKRNERLYALLNP